MQLEKNNNLYYKNFKKLNFFSLKLIKNLVFTFRQRKNLDSFFYKQKFFLNFFRNNSFLKFMSNDSNFIYAKLRASFRNNNTIYDYILLKNYLIIC